VNALPTSPTPAPHAEGVAEVAATFLKLGLTSFGGPVAHLGYIRAECVEKRKWLDDAQYGDLVALCQFLPGPSSSQVVFAVGMHRAGLAGALAASLGFLLPSAVLMIAFAYGVAALGDLRGAGWLHGLKLAAVAVVAQAVWSMGGKLCPDRPRLSLCLVAAAITLVLPGALGQMGVIVGGALVGWWFYRDLPTPPQSAEEARAGGHRAAVAALVAFLGLLVAPRFVAAATGERSVAVFDAFYRAGALVFGGGHVVLPFWQRLRATAWMQAALRGANAAVVGVLLAALYTPVVTEGVHNAGDVAAALVAFGLLEVWKAPPWAVVVLAAAAGQWVLR